jgi:hypothetical protein
MTDPGVPDQPRKLNHAETRGHRLVPPRGGGGRALIRDRQLRFGEEANQDVFEQALRTWPVRGFPHNPAGWIITTARNRAIDRLRRGRVGAVKELQAEEVRALEMLGSDYQQIPDERLRLSSPVAIPPSRWRRGSRSRCARSADFLRAKSLARS